MYIKKCIEPELPMLDQLSDGLQLFDVLKMIRTCKEKMRKSFTADYRVEITPDVLLGIMNATFSHNEQLKDLETQTYKVFCDFIQLLHYGGNVFVFLFLLLDSYYTFCNIEFMNMAQDTLSVCNNLHE